MAQTANGYNFDVKKVSNDVLDWTIQNRRRHINRMYAMDNVITSWQHSPTFNAVFPPWGRMHRLMNLFKFGLGVSRALARGQGRLAEIVQQKLVNAENSDTPIDGNVVEVMEYDKQREASTQQQRNYDNMVHHLNRMMNVLDGVDRTGMTQEELDLLDFVRNNISSMQADVTDMSEFEGEMAEAYGQAEESAAIQDAQANAEAELPEEDVPAGDVGLEAEPEAMEETMEAQSYDTEVNRLENASVEGAEDDVQVEDAVEYQEEEVVNPESTAAIDEQSFADAEEEQFEEETETADDLVEDDASDLVSDESEEEIDESAENEEENAEDLVDDESEPVQDEGEENAEDLVNDESEAPQDDGEENAEDLVNDDSESVQNDGEENAEDLVDDSSEPVQNDGEENAQDLVGDDGNNGGNDGGPEDGDEPTVDDDTAEEPTSDGSTDVVPPDQNPEPEPDEPMDDKPSEDEPVVDEPSEEEPSEDELTDEEPSEEEPVDDKPVDEEPVTDDPAEEPPAEEEPVDEVPGTDNPTEEPPAEEEPVDENPVTEEPVEEQPVDGDIPGEEIPDDGGNGGDGSPDNGDEPTIGDDTAEEPTSDGSTDSVAPPADSEPEDDDDLYFDGKEEFSDDSAEKAEKDSPDNDKTTAGSGEHRGVRGGPWDGPSAAGTARRGNPAATAEARENAADIASKVGKTNPANYDGMNRTQDSSPAKNGTLRSLDSSSSSAAQLADSTDAAIESVSDNKKADKTSKKLEMSERDKTFEDKYGIQSSGVKSVKEWEDSSFTALMRDDASFHKQLGLDLYNFKSSTTMKLMSQGKIPGITFDDYNGLVQNCNDLNRNSGKLGREIDRQDVLYKESNVRYQSAVDKNAITAGHVNDIMRADLKGKSNYEMSTVCGDIQSSTNALQSSFDDVVKKMENGYKQRGSKMPMVISDELHTMNRAFKRDALTAGALKDNHAAVSGRYATFEKNFGTLDNSYQKDYANYLTSPEKSAESSVSAYDAQLKLMQQQAQDKGLSHAMSPDVGVDLGR